MTPAGRAPRRGVAVLCSGGLEHAGGIGRAMAYLLDQWALDPNAPAATVLDTRGGGHLAFAPLFFLRSLLQLAFLRLTGRIDLVHVNIASRGSTARKCVVVALCAPLRLRFVMHLHGAQFHMFLAGLPAPGKALVRWMFRRAERVIVLGEVWRRFAVEQLHVAPERIDVICNGVPAAQPFPPHEGPVHIVFLGRLGDRKGVPELLAALASPRLAGREWRATLAGDGEIDRFRREAAGLALEGRTVFPGWIGQGEAAALLDAGDIFVLPSRNEGLPVAVLEALARSLPIVATPVGSLPEFLADGDSALLVPPGDADALARALERLVTMPKDRHALGERGHAVFHRHFDIATTARAVRESHEAARMPRPRAVHTQAFAASGEG